MHCILQFSSAQSLSQVQIFVTPGTAACQASMSITISRRPLKLPSIALIMPSSHLILCHPLLLPPSIFPNIRDFPNESSFPSGDWSFSISISPSNEYWELISLRMDWLGLFAFQESSPTPQFKSINSSVLNFFFFFSFLVQLSHPYMTTGKNHSFD